MKNISFCITIIDLQNEIFNMTYIMYHTKLPYKIHFDEFYEIFRFF